MLNYTPFENTELTYADATKLFGGTTYVGQTFTPGTAHTIYEIELGLIRVGTSGTVTLNIYATSTGAPTGSSLATATVAQSSIGTSAAMVTFTLNSALSVGNDKYAIVLSAAGSLGSIGWRFKTAGSYTAGSAWSSTDSGVTWTETAASDLIFCEWGISLPIYGATRIPIYPRKNGSYSQLYPTKHYNGPQYTPPTALKNWQCVSDLADSPDDSGGFISYDLGNGFDSGKSESVAGYITGTKLLWKSGYSGLWGTGTTFLTEMVAGQYVKPGIKNTWCTDPALKVLKIASVETDTALTFSSSCGSYNVILADQWFYTPTEVTDGGWHNYHESSYGIGDLFPMARLDGTWTWNSGHSVTGSGGNATSVYPYDHPYAGRGLICRGTKSSGDDSNFAEPIDEVTDDNTIVIIDEINNSKEDVAGWTKYAFLSQYETLDSTGSMWCNATKKDAYLTKYSLIQGNVRQIDVYFRVCCTGPEAGGYTGTAQPFLRLNSTDSLGTAVTLTSSAWTNEGYEYEILPYRYPFKTYCQTISRPGGGVFTNDDLATLEVGIILGNVSDVNASVICTQLYPELVVSATPWLANQTVGLTQYGFRTFSNRLDEWGVPVFPNGMNMMAHKIYNVSTSVVPYVSKPIQVLRDLTSKFLGRRKTSSSPKRTKTSGSIFT
jgi:hypothetical protein